MKDGGLCNAPRRHQCVTLRRQDIVGLLFTATKGKIGFALPDIELREALVDIEKARVNPWVRVQIKDALCLIQGFLRVCILIVLSVGKGYAKLYISLKQ